MKSAHIVLVAMILAVLPSGGSLLAQEAPPLAPGQRVRVTDPAAGLDRTVATIRAVHGREIVLGVTRFHPQRDYGGSTDTLNVAESLDSLRSLEVAIGTRTHFWLGAGIGAARRS